MPAEFQFQSILIEAFEKFRTNSSGDSSLREFSKFLGINSGTLSLILKGKRSLNTVNAKKVAERLELPPVKKQAFLKSIAEYKGRKVQDDAFETSAGPNLSLLVSLNDIEEVSEALKKCLGTQSRSQSKRDISADAGDDTLVTESAQAIANFEKAVSLLRETQDSERKYVLSIALTAVATDEDRKLEEDTET